MVELGRKSRADHLLLPHPLVLSLFRRNVPGVAAYFYTLSEIRYALAQLGYFSLPIPIPLVSDPSSSNQSTTSTLPKLSREGNLLAGAIARTGVGFVMNPVTVLKARYEVSPSHPFAQKGKIKEGEGA